MAMLNLIEKAKTEYVIVCGKSASLCERKAAAELQKYLQQISGTVIPVVSDDVLAKDKEIVVGRTNRETKEDFDRKELGEEGFVIKTTGQKLWLIGGADRGTIYSVYTFLEEYLGCRFYMEKIEKIPQMQKVSIPEIKEDKQIPVLMFRDAAWYDYFGTDISVKRKINAPIWGRELPEDVGGGVTYCKGKGGHTFEELVPPEEYFDEHPEYYTMNEEGVRVPNKQLCLTNPEVLELTIKGVLEWLADEPDTSIISVSQNDWGGPCLCENCRKVYEEEGGAYSGAVIRFVNEVAKEVKKHYPKVWVDTYAYSYTRSAPTKVKPEDNVLVRLCTMGTCFSHEKEGSTCLVDTASTYLDGSANSFSEDIEAWAKISKTLFVYDYTCNYQHWSLTFPDFANLRKNVKYYVDNHAIGLEMQGNQLSSSIEFSELRSYLLSKILWNPYMSEEEYYAHMDDFLDGVYGPGGKYVREYIAIAEEQTRDNCFGLVTSPYNMYPLSFMEVRRSCEFPEKLTYEMLQNYKDVDWSLYWNWNMDVKENPITAKGEELFETALLVAETDEQRQQLDRIYCQVKYIKSYYHKMRMIAGREGFNRMLHEYVANHPEHTIDIPAIVNAGWEQMEEKYIRYNKELEEKIVSHGVTYLWEGLLIEEFKPFNYANVPVDWPRKNTFRLQ